MYITLFHKFLHNKFCKCFKIYILIIILIYIFVSSCWSTSNSLIMGETCIWKSWRDDAWWCECCARIQPSKSQVHSIASTHLRFENNQHTICFCQGCGGGWHSSPHCWIRWGYQSADRLQLQYTSHFRALPQPMDPITVPEQRPLRVWVFEYDIHARSSSFWRNPWSAISLWSQPRGP